MGGPGAPKKLKTWEKSQLFLLNSQLYQSQLSKKKLPNWNLKNRIHSRNDVVFGPFFPKESETVKSARENASLIMSNHHGRGIFPWGVKLQSSRKEMRVYFFSWKFVFVFVAKRTTRISWIMPTKNFFFFEIPRTFALRPPLECIWVRTQTHSSGSCSAKMRGFSKKKFFFVGILQLFRVVRFAPHTKVNFHGKLRVSSLSWKSVNSSRKNPPSKFFAEFVWHGEIESHRGLFTAETKVFSDGTQTSRVAHW